MQIKSLKIAMTFLTISAHQTYTQNAVANDTATAYETMINSSIDTVTKLAALFPKSVQQVQDWLECGMQLAQRDIDTIIAIPANERTFANTVQAFDVAKSKLSRLACSLSLLLHVSPDLELQKAIQVALEKLETFTVDLYFNPELYRAFQEYQTHAHNPQVLTQEDIKLFDEIMQSFKDEGFHLPAQQFAKIKELKKEIGQLELEFGNNMNADAPSIHVLLEELAGVDQQFIDDLARDGDAYILNINFHTYAQIIQNCSVSSTRKKIFLAFRNHAYETNDAVLKKLLATRHAFAQVLGHPNFACFDIQGTMANTEQTVEQFLKPLLDAAAQKAAQELALLKQAVPDQVPWNADGTLYMWDYPYALNCYKQKYCNIDESQIAQYFPVQKVVDGVFAIYQKVLGLTFKRVQAEWSWHQDVELIEIYDTKTGEFFGYIFLDLYPRAHKFKHVAACAPQVYSYEKQGKNTPAVCSIIANLTKPCGDSPALLKHDDVVIFFHEFGHAMHMIMGRTQHHSFSGFHVKADFTEMPSQMFEQWMYEPDILTMVSSHYQTGQALPADIIAKKIDFRNIDTGMLYLRLSLFSLFALQLMQQDNVSPDLLWQKLHEQYYKNIFAYEPNYHFYTSWFHIADSGYASKYYNYLWAEVLSLDVFDFVKAQEFNATSQEQIQTILKAGGSIDPNKLLYDVLGREPNQDAFLKINGLR